VMGKWVWNMQMSPIGVLKWNNTNEPVRYNTHIVIISYAR
jgi:hypothetical protein